MFLFEMLVWRSVDIRAVRVWRHDVKCSRVTMKETKACSRSSAVFVEPGWSLCVHIHVPYCAVCGSQQSSHLQRVSPFALSMPLFAEQDDLCFVIAEVAFEPSNLRLKLLDGYLLTCKPVQHRPSWKGGDGGRRLACSNKQEGQSYFDTYGKKH